MSGILGGIKLWIVWKWNLVAIYVGPREVVYNLAYSTMF